MSIRRKILTVLLAFVLGSVAGPSESIVIPDTGNIHSTYAPDVIYRPGWDRFRMYFGRNRQDRPGDKIYLAECFGANGAPPDGVNGWQVVRDVLNRERVILDAGGPGESFLIHDPAVTVYQRDGQNYWLMFYTGTDDPNGLANRIFIASSSDGVSWTKHGPLVMPDIEQVAVSNLTRWGWGNPGVYLDETQPGQMRLYVYFTATRINSGESLMVTWTDLLAHPEGYSGYQRPIPLNSFTTPNPYVFTLIKSGKPTYYVIFDAVNWAIYNSTVGRPATYTAILGAELANNSPTGALVSSTIRVIKRIEPGTRREKHLGTACYLPSKNLLYFAGANTTTDFMFDQADLLVDTRPLMTPILQNSATTWSIY